MYSGVESDVLLSRLNQCSNIFIAFASSISLVKKRKKEDVLDVVN